MPRLANAQWELDPSLAPLVELILQHRPHLGELYPMLLNSPPIAEGMLHFGNAVRKKASLDGKIRELVICCVGILSGATYEVYRHKEIALAEGVPPEQLAALESWRESPLFAPNVRAALAYAEAITTDIRVADEIFEPLRAFYSEREILEITVTAAYYNMICRILEALQIEVPHAARVSAEA